MVGQAVSLAVLMGNVDLAVVWVERRALVVDVARGLIVTIYGRDVVLAVAYLTEQSASHVVQVQLHVAAAVAGYE